MTEAQQLDPKPIPEVHLDRPPLARGLAQARFPPILTINRTDEVASFQEALRDTYPNLSRDQVHGIELAGGQSPNVHQDLIWRLADADSCWRVSLGVNFVALETSDHGSRDDFLARLCDSLSAVEESFNPAPAGRLGVHFIDRLTGPTVERIGELIRAEILGVIQPTDTLDLSLRKSVIHQITEAQLQAPGGTLYKVVGADCPPIRHTALTLSRRSQSRYGFWTSTCSQPNLRTSSITMDWI